MKRKITRTPRIVQSSAGQWLLIWVIVLLVAALLASGAYLYTFHYTEIIASWTKCEEAPPVAHVVDTQRIDELEEQMLSLEKERDEYRMNSARYQRASQIDQQTVIKVQADLKELQEERAELRQQVAFLKSLVSGDVTSLQLVDFSLDQSEKAGTYNYALTLSKRAKGQDKVQGDLVFNVVGKQTEKTVTLQAKDLVLTGSRLKMNFQNFQNYKGTFVLPDNFVPEVFRIKVNPQGKKFKSFEKSFPWQLVLN